VQSGERVGDRQGKRSHARELRRALWNAGIHAPLEGFEQAMGELRAAESQLLGFRPGSGREAYRAALQRAARARAAAMKLDVLQSGSERFRAVDFHSFRRAFNTALGAAGVNVQQAMALAGHKDPRTHMRYVQLGQRGPLPTPLAALPVLPLLGTKLTETLRPHGDLNPGYRRESEGQNSRSSINKAGFAPLALWTKPTETLGNETLGQNLVDETRAASDAALRAYLSTLASAVSRRYSLGGAG
jgi:hypothetical protein